MAMKPCEGLMFSNIALIRTLRKLDLGKEADQGQRKYGEGKLGETS